MNLRQVSKAYMFTLADNHVGANVPVTPSEGDIISPSTVNRSCTFRNKEELQVLAMGKKSLKVKRVYMVR